MFYNPLYSTNSDAVRQTERERERERERDNVEELTLMSVDGVSC